MYKTFPKDTSLYKAFISGLNHTDVYTIETVFDGYYSLMVKNKDFSEIISNGYGIQVHTDKALWVAENVLKLKPESDRIKGKVDN